MGGWVDEWVDGWMDGWMGGLEGGWVGEWLGGNVVLEVGVLFGGWVYGNGNPHFLREGIVKNITVTLIFTSWPYFFSPLALGLYLVLHPPIFKDVEEHNGCMHLYIS